MFKYSKTTMINCGQANAHRIDVGLGGLITFGGDFLSLIKQEEDGEITDISRDYEDSKF